MPPIPFQSVLICLSFAVASSAMGQRVESISSIPTQFPESAVTPSETELSAYVKGGVFKATYASGLGLRWEFKEKHVFVDLSNGARDSGTWRTETGKLCVEFVGRFNSGCVEARFSNGLLFAQRTSEPREVFTMRKD